MNSLNIITARVSPSSSPAPSRSNSFSSMGLATMGSEEDEKAGEQSTDRARTDHDTEPFPTGDFGDNQSNEHHYNDEKYSGATEDTPLLAENKDTNRRWSWWHSLPRDIATSFINSIRWALATLASPGVYLVACLYDEQGNFAPLPQLKKLFGGRRPRRRGNGSSAVPSTLDEKLLRAPADSRRHGLHQKTRPHVSSGSSSSGMSSESDSEGSKASSMKQSRPHTRSKSLQGEEINPARRSIRIKLHNDEAMGNRKHRKTQSAVARSKGMDDGEKVAAHLKSPTSPVTALTKYPKTPAPPRPLIPRRQPSYLNLDPSSNKQRKTLILDLDETLIHSMSKGGRMSTGHMVEVRLNTATLGVTGQQQAAQHPILYWVNKRPHCDEFLRRVDKWYNLVIFTASVQEYADPVIDWLESERKFFSARYYRQHCTFRQGAYIKDLSSVEPDLSKALILDNSPLSYLFHEDNAIPIQGWISDPTDYDLMHLVPLLEGLQYVHDVRAFLALRGGEDGHST